MWMKAKCNTCSFNVEVHDWKGCIPFYGDFFLFLKTDKISYLICCTQKKQKKKLSNDFSQRLFNLPLSDEWTFIGHAYSPAVLIAVWSYFLDFFFSLGSVKRTCDWGMLVNGSATALDQVCRALCMMSNWKARVKLAFTKTEKQLAVARDNFEMIKTQAHTFLWLCDLIIFS